MCDTISNQPYKKIRLDTAVVVSCTGASVASIRRNNQSKRAEEGYDVDTSRYYFPSFSNIHLFFGSTYMDSLDSNPNFFPTNLCKKQCHGGTTTTLHSGNRKVIIIIISSKHDVKKKSTFSLVVDYCTEEGSNCIGGSVLF